MCKCNTGSHFCPTNYARISVHLLISRHRGETKEKRKLMWPLCDMYKLWNSHTHKLFSSTSLVRRHLKFVPHMCRLIGSGCENDWSYNKNMTGILLVFFTVCRGKHAWSLVHSQEFIINGSLACTLPVGFACATNHWKQTHQCRSSCIPPFVLCHWQSRAMAAKLKQSKKQHTTVVPVKAWIVDVGNFQQYAIKVSVFGQCWLWLTSTSFTDCQREFHPLLQCFAEDQR